MLKTINATVNHELRNPLNSIVTYNKLNQKLYAKIENILKDELLTET